MAETEAAIGYGSSLQVEADLDASPTVFVDLGEVFNITPPSSEVDQIDATHMQSPNRTREFIDGLIDAGECSFEMNYIPGGTADQTLLTLLALPTGQRRRRWRIIYPNSVQDTFSANIQNYAPEIPTDDKMTAEVTLKVSGSPVRAAAAAPANLVLPAISGVLTVGSTLNAHPGTWSGGPSYAYQWKNAGVNISGATSSQYVVQGSDSGDAITVAVTATNSQGSASATSAAVVIA